MGRPNQQPARIYLDNAATSWPKPPAVLAAMQAFLQEGGGSAGRGGHAAATDADAIVQRARKLVASLIGAANPASIAFAFNGTDALNQAIHGSLQPGDHVVTTVVEHNAVLRPLAHAAHGLPCEVTMVDCNAQGMVSADAVLAAVRKETRLVAITHASNVTGAVQPIEPVCTALTGHPALVLVDASQTVGHVELDVQSLGVDLLAASGHKGCLGPTGTGFLYVRPGVEQHLQATRQGGSGQGSESEFQPTQMPTLLEAGNLNVVGLAGLAAGIEYLQEKTVAAVAEHVQQLCQRFIHGGQQLPGCQIYGPLLPEQRTGVVSLTLEGYDPHEVGMVLEMTIGAQCRAGLHCAPRMHQRLATSPAGTLRISPGPFTTASEIDQVLAALATLNSTQ